MSSANNHEVHGGKINGVDDGTSLDDTLLAHFDVGCFRNIHNKYLQDNNVLHRQEKGT